MKWILIDTHYLCHRAFHTTGDLSHRGIKTGVIYGVLREICQLTNLFQTENLVFCFDSKESRRREEVFEGYKLKRMQKILNAPPEERKARAELDRQIKLLRTKYLPAIGYKNLFVQCGYEADDLIASVALNSVNVAKNQVFVVSSDKDLYQLLSFYVKMYNPQTGRVYTFQDFMQEWGIHPLHWYRVKAIAGCKGDDVPGVEGVAEKTAIKFINGNFHAEHPIRLRILASFEMLNRNYRLVSLPYAGTKIFILRRNVISPKGWKRVLVHLGITRLANPPKIEVEHGDKRKQSHRRNR